MCGTSRFLEKLTAVQRHRARLLRQVGQALIVIGWSVRHFQGRVACLLCCCCCISVFIHPCREHQILRQHWLSAFQIGEHRTGLLSGRWNEHHATTLVSRRDVNKQHNKALVNLDEIPHRRDLNKRAYKLTVRSLFSMTLYKTSSSAFSQWCRGDRFFSSPFWNGRR